MYIAQRTLTFMNALLKSYGPSSVKKFLWDQEFSEGKWNFIDNTVGDCVYAHLENHTKGGSILDLGCGPGNTATELDATKYSSYVGVDISEVCLAKAAKRSAEIGRATKNRFMRSDFISYAPDQKFDVILFREAIYHVPFGKVKPVLDRYSEYLKAGGVFVVRVFTLGDNGRKIKHRPKATLNLIEAEFDVVERRQYGDKAGSEVVVFRPRYRH
jgi:2-polyprenyl-3-methyl-5-hydroxy-6-metoxy-1,4-benzoquinol methylase